LDRGLEKLTSGFKALFGGKDSKDQQSAVQPPREQQLPASPLESLPAPFQLALALFKPIFGMLGGLLQESQGDVEAVLEKARAAVRRSGRFGSSAECGPVFGQTYSSMNINGRKSAQVGLQFQVTGDGRSGMATCSAIVDENGVALQNMRVDGYDVNVAGGGAGGGEGGVIDVQR